MTNEEAIDILRNAAWLGTDADREQIENAVEMAINALTAQPEKRTEERTETHACDCISRRAAVDAVSNMLRRKFGIGGDLAEITLAGLPSAQPEIIYCGDCRYKDDGIDENGIPFLKCLHGRSYGGTRINDFCSWAERRTDEQTD